MVTTHDSVLAWEVADRFVVMEGGEVRKVLNRMDLADLGVGNPEELRKWLLEVYG